MSGQLRETPRQVGLETGLRAITNAAFKERPVMGAEGFDPLVHFKPEEWDMVENAQRNLIPQVSAIPAIHLQRFATIFLARIKGFKINHPITEEQTKKDIDLATREARSAGNHGFDTIVFLAYVKLLQDDNFSTDMIPNDSRVQRLLRADNDNAALLGAALGHRILFPEKPRAEFFRERKNQTEGQAWTEAKDIFTAVLQYFSKADESHKISHARLVAHDAAFYRLLFPDQWNKEALLTEKQAEELITYFHLSFVNGDWYEFFNLGFFLTIIGAEDARLDIKGQIAYTPPFHTETQERRELPEALEIEKHE